MYDVQVLMSTYNGEKYLRTQIDSILKQEGVKVHLFVRDDGSSDSTCKILDEYAEEGKLKWYTGDNLRSARSFMNLIKNSDDYDFYAFSDQDDYWLPDKLIQAVNRLTTKNDVPALYYGATTLVDLELKLLDQDVENRAFVKFNNAVISSNATGCTFCFNKKLRDIINIYQPMYQIMHDGWLHKVCLAVGGYVYYDEKSYIYYRQHGENVVGGTTTPLKRWKRRLDTLKKDPCPRSRGIQELFNGYGKFMSQDNVKICKEICEYKHSLKNRIKLLFDKNIYSTNKRIDRFYRVTVMLGIF